MNEVSRSHHVLVVVITALCAGFMLSSCGELEARRTIQKADKLYEDGKYDEAIALYEKSIKASDLGTAHHNLAIAAFAAFQPGIETETNKAYAMKASEHFQAYLKKNPKDSEIVELLTTVWLDSEQTDVALAFWEKARQAAPKDPNPLKKLRSIEVMAGNFDAALAWDWKRVDLAGDPKEKVVALVQIGQLQYSRLSKATLFDEERVQVADTGIAAIQQALALQPENASLHSLVATLYQFRALAHQNGWAQSVDAASQRHHHLQRKKIAEKTALKNGKSQGAAPAPGPSSEAPAGKEKE